MARRTSTQSTRRARWAARVLTAFLAFSLTSAASPAWAADGLELSSDGITFGPSLTTPLFASMPPLVPQQSADTTFVVRNSGTVPAYLSVVLSARGWDEREYASKLSVEALTPGAVSHEATLTSSDRCAVILEGKILEPGQTALVTTTVRLGDLDGSTGQQTSAWMVFTVKLTQAISSRTPRACTSGGSSVVVFPGGPSEQSSPTPTPTPTATGSGAGEVPTDPPGLDPFANTGFGFDARVVVLAAFAVPAGALFFWLLGLRRRPRYSPDSQYTPTPRIEMENTP